MRLRIKARILNLFYPAKCVLCNKIIKAEHEEICPVCRLSLPKADMILRLGSYHEGVVSALRYENEVRDAIIRYKFNGQFWLGEVFGALMAETVAAKLSGRFDVITWTPVSLRRKLQRTYDQSELLANPIGRLLNVPVAQCLKKTKHTAANSSLTDEKERRSNVAGVYEALPGFENKRILLIDDVYTTGSTLSECAKTLMRAGAESVVCATLARAGE